MSKSKFEIISSSREPMLLEEAARSRIVDAVRAHILEDIGAKNLTVGFSLDFGLVVDF